MASDLDYDPDDFKSPLECRTGARVIILDVLIFLKGAAIIFFSI